MRLLLPLLQAEDLGLGSCWIQIRERYTEEEEASNDYIKSLFNIPIQLQVLSVIVFGNKAQERSPIDDEKLQWGRKYISETLI